MNLRGKKYYLVETCSSCNNTNTKRQEQGKQYKLKAGTILIEFRKREELDHVDFK